MHTLCTLRAINLFWLRLRRSPSRSVQRPRNANNLQVLSKPNKVAVSTWSIPSSFWSGQKWSIPSSLWSGQNCWWYFGRRVVSSIDPPLSSCFSQNSVTHCHRHHFCHSPIRYHPHFCVHVFFGIPIKLRQEGGEC